MKRHCRRSCAAGKRLPVQTSTAACWQCATGYCGRPEQRQVEQTRHKPRRRCALQHERAACIGASAQLAPDAATQARALRDTIPMKMWRAWLHTCEPGRRSSKLQLALWCVICLRIIKSGTKYHGAASAPCARDRKRASWAIASFGSAVSAHNCAE